MTTYTCTYCGETAELKDLSTFGRYDDGSMSILHVDSQGRAHTSRTVEIVYEPRSTR